MKMNMPYWNQFYAQLPISVYVMGRMCSIRQFNNYGCDFFVDYLVAHKVAEGATYSFEGRKWLVTTVGLSVPLSLSECREDIMSKKAIADFLDYFLSQPIGPRLFTFDQSREFRFYDSRVMAVNQAYLTWFALNYSARRSNGRLKFSIPCAGYFRDSHTFGKLFVGSHYCVTGMCHSNVLDMSGCCPSHRKATSKTLFNFYPHFDNEGHLQISQEDQDEPVPVDDCSTKFRREFFGKDSEDKSTDKVQP